MPTTFLQSCAKSSRLSSLIIAKFAAEVAADTWLWPCMAQVKSNGSLEDGRQWTRKIRVEYDQLLT